MRIWLIQVGDVIPTNNKKNRLMRTALFAKALYERGHEVYWWTSTFCHVQKKHLYIKEVDKKTEEGFVIKFLKGSGYKKNISFKRIWHHWQLAKRFLVRAKKEPKPDIIISAYPTIELSVAAVDFGEKRRIPVIIDVRDLWPDVFPYHFHPVVKPFIRLGITPLLYASRYIFRNASAIIGITDEFVDWAVNRAGRNRHDLDVSFPFTYPEEIPTDLELKEAEQFWNSLGIDGKRFTVCFIGSFDHTFDFRTVIYALKILENEKIPYIGVFVGDGEVREKCNVLSNKFGTNIIFPGWLERSYLYVLMRRCHIGVNPLINRFDFLGTINNKVVEYLSAGLPIVSSPKKGTLHRLLKEWNCGLSYDANDPEELAELIKFLINNPGKLNEMAKASRKVYEVLFTYKKISREFSLYVEKVVKNFRKGHES